MDVRFILIFSHYVGGDIFFEKRCCSSYVDSYTYLFILTYVFIGQNYSHSSIVYLATDLTTYPILNIYHQHSMLHFCTYTGIKFVHIRVFLLQFVWMTSTAFALISHGGSSRKCQKLTLQNIFF